MSTSNGFTEINGIFDSVADLQKYSGKSISTVAVNNGTVLDWYQVSTIDNGSAVALDSGLFANNVAPSVAGFGTAAYADLTTSPTDPTVGRVLKVGDVINADTLDSLDSTQFLRSDVAGTINGELTIGGSSVSGGEGGQIAFTKAPFSTHTYNPVLDSQGDVLRYLSSAGGTTRALTFPPETGTVLHSGSLAFLQNQSGGTVGSTATVAGSSLLPTQAGTWRNVSGGNILNNGWGLWGIV